MQLVRRLSELIPDPSACSRLLHVGVEVVKMLGKLNTICHWCVALLTRLEGDLLLGKGWERRGCQGCCFSTTSSTVDTKVDSNHRFSSPAAIFTAYHPGYNVAALSSLCQAHPETLYKDVIGPRRLVDIVKELQWVVAGWTFTANSKSSRSLPE